MAFSRGVGTYLLRGSASIRAVGRRKKIRTYDWYDVNMVCGRHRVSIIFYRRGYTRGL